MEEEVVVYIYPVANLLPALLPVPLICNLFCNAICFILSVTLAWHLLGINEWFCR